MWKSFCSMHRTVSKSIINVCVQKLSDSQLRLVASGHLNVMLCLSFSQRDCEEVRELWIHIMFCSINGTRCNVKQRENGQHHPRDLLPRDFTKGWNFMEIPILTYIIHWPRGFESNTSNIWVKFLNIIDICKNRLENPDKHTPRVERVWHKICRCPFLAPRLRIHPQVPISLGKSREIHPCKISTGWSEPAPTNCSFASMKNGHLLFICSSSSTSQSSIHEELSAFFF